MNRAETFWLLSEWFYTMVNIGCKGMKKSNLPKKNNENCIFLPKNLVMSKKSSTFAVAFRKIFFLKDDIAE